MYKTFIAGITAASLTLTSAAPVSASGIDEERLGQILFGLFATAAVAKIIDSQTDSPKAVRTKPKQTAPATPRHNPRMTLPRRCLRSVAVGTGELRLFTRRCIQRHYDHRVQFPRRCEVSLRTRDGRRNGWDAHCMRKAGYRAGRR